MAADICIAVNGDDAISQKKIASWTLLTAKCSCYISLQGSEQSEFSIVVVKASPDQKQMRLSAMLSVTSAFKHGSKALPIVINGQLLNAETVPLAKTLTVELADSIDWISAITEAQSIMIGQYNFSSTQSRKAMEEFRSCYAGLSGL